MSLSNIRTLLFFNALSIFAISIFGRELQAFTFRFMSPAHFYIFIMLGLILGFGFIYLIQKHNPIQLFVVRATACTALMFVTQSFIEIPEEKLHLLLFSLLGLLCFLSFKLSVAILIALAVSLADEVLQHYLPRRYFGLHDVLINAYAAVATILIFSFKQTAYLQGIRARGADEP